MQAQATDDSPEDIPLKPPFSVLDYGGCFGGFYAVSDSQGRILTIDFAKPNFPKALAKIMNENSGRLTRAWNRDLASAGTKEK